MTEITSYDGTYRILGLNNSYFDTNDLVDAELAMLKLQISPTESQKKLLTEERAVWAQFKNDFTSLADVLNTSWLFNAGEKNTTYSKEGILTLKTNSDAVEADYNIKVNSLAEKHQIAGKALGSVDDKLGVEDKIKINDKELSITEDMSLRDVVKSINSGDFGTSASIISGRLVLTSKNSGEEGKIKLQDGTGGGLQQLGVLNEEGSISTELKAAKNATYSINGIAHESQTNEISNAIDGVTLNLTGVSTEGINVSVKSNKDAVLTQIKTLVNTYNSSMIKFNNYTAKGTYLQGQSLPINLRRDLSAMSSFKNSDGSYLYQFGVEVDGTAKDGTLKLDIEKLEKEFDKDPQKVIDMFLGDKGVAKEMKSKVDLYTKETGSINTKIEGIDKNLKIINDTIANFDSSYEQRKQSILKKYADFETRMAGLNSELAYMEAQIKSFNSSKD